jgi:hypothetical protein
VDAAKVEVEEAEVDNLVLWMKASRRHCWFQWSHNVWVKPVNALELGLGRSSVCQWLVKTVVVIHRMVVGEAT